jgi:hypothetical protein
MTPRHHTPEEESERLRQGSARMAELDAEILKRTLTPIQFAIARATGDDPASVTFELPRPPTERERRAQVPQPAPSAAHSVTPKKKEPAVPKHNRNPEREHMMVLNALITTEIQKSAERTRDDVRMLEVNRRIERQLIQEAEEHAAMRARTREDARISAAADDARCSRRPSVRVRNGLSRRGVA